MACRHPPASTWETQPLRCAYFSGLQRVWSRYSIALDKLIINHAAPRRNAPGVPALQRDEDEIQNTETPKVEAAEASFARHLTHLARLAGAAPRHCRLPRQAQHGRLGADHGRAPCR